MSPAPPPIDFSGAIQALVGNALDQAERDECSAVAVELFDDAVRVADDGRGLPVHPHPRTGRSLLELIMLGPRRPEKNTLARVNAACLWLEVEIHRAGQLWFQRYELGRPATALHRRGSATRRGTTISCAPARGQTPSFDDLCQFVREQVAQRPGLRVKIRLRDNRVARDETIVVS